MVVYIKFIIFIIYLVLLCPQNKSVHSFKNLSKGDSIKLEYTLIESKTHEQQGNLWIILYELSKLTDSLEWNKWFTRMIQTSATYERGSFRTKDSEWIWGSVKRQRTV